MEEEKKEQSPKPTVKRKINVFKKRRQAPIRPFVKEANKKKYWKMLQAILISFGIILFITVLLYAGRELILTKVLNSQKNLINPQGAAQLTQDQMRKSLSQSPKKVDSIIFYQDVIEFKYDDRIKVYIDSRKDIVTQLGVVNAIDHQVNLSGKKATLIDLRYNKPIVKF